MAPDQGPAAVTTARPSAVPANLILPASGTMIGICTTLVGLVKIMEGRSGPSSVDQYGFGVAIFFLTSALFAYLTIRLSPGAPKIGRYCERIADVAFLLGLFCLVGLIGLFAFGVV